MLAACALAALWGYAAGAFVPRAADAGASAGRCRQRPVRRSAAQGDADIVAVPELWLDCRKNQRVFIDGITMAAPDSEHIKEIKVRLSKLSSELSVLMDNLGLPQPTGKLVDAVLVETDAKDDALEDAKALGLRVYYAARTLTGFEPLDVPNSDFLIDAATDVPVAAVAPLSMQYGLRPVAAKIWRYEAEVEKAVIEEKKAKFAAEMQRYREGLEDESKYVFPPKTRMAELMGLDKDTFKAGGPLTRSGVFARLLPPDPTIWGRAWIERQKQINGGAKVPYKLKDNDDV